MRDALVLDFGGTWLAARLDRKGRPPLRRRVKAPRPEALPALVRRLARAWRSGRLSSLTVGSRGVWTGSQRRALARRLAGLAARVRVIPDFQLAHEEAFAGGPGILVVGGTGSAAFGRDARGRTARAGGLGPLLGDEGSAFWLGKEALKDPRLSRRLGPGLALRLAHSREPVRGIAALASRVLSLAQKEPAAAALRARAAGHLAALAGELARRLEFRGSVPVSWRGGLFEDAALKARFLRALRRENRRLVPAPPR